VAPADPSPRDLSVYHERTRRRGVNPWVYWPVRAVLQPFMQVYFRLVRAGRTHVPRRGGVIMASNHRSFLDPFVIGCCVPRPMYFVAKEELFEHRIVGWFLNCMGAFPVRRGAADAESLLTARTLLERGAVVTIFPEGTRVQSGSLLRPRRGVGRMALETGAAVVPVAVVGSERARRGWRIRPARVRVRCGRALSFPHVREPSPRLATEVSARIWPCVELQWEWLGGLPPLRRAAVVGAGSMGTALATVLARAGLEVQLGCRTADQSARLADRGENAEYLPGEPLPAEVSVSSVGDIEFGGVDLVVFAVPTDGLPQAVAQVGDRVGRRSAALVVSKGLVGALGLTPSSYVAERLQIRGIACLAGPAHAGETVAEGASVVLASDQTDLRRQLVTVLGDAGLDVHESTDLVGVEMAGVAKNAAALGAAAAASAGMNVAGAAAGRIFAEVHELALRAGGGSEAFVGLAGAGDLVGTVLAAGSRNRRAGELLARGVPAGQIAGILGQAAEALDSVPRLAERLERAGVSAPATAALAGLVSGRTDAQAWIDTFRAPPTEAGGRRAA